MKNLVPGILFSVAFFVCFIMSGYFFSLTNITLNSFLTINSIALIDSIMSLNFLLFCISSSVGIGIIISMGSFYNLKEASIISIPAYVLSILVLVVAFNLTSFFVPLILGTFAIPICLMSIQKAREMKTFPILRAGIYSSGKFVMIIGIALFVVLLIIGLTQSQELEKNFTTDLLSTMVGNNLTLSDQFVLQFAQSIAAQQVNTIDLMLEQTELTNLIESNSIDAINYHQKLIAYRNAYQEEEYLSKLATSMKNNKINFGEEFLTKFPILRTVAKYTFIVYPFMAFIMIMFIGNIIIKNLAGLVFSGIVKYVPDKEETEKKA
ncbi:MAG: hypothetical protein WC108_08125 [Bacteroidales bacterium]